MKPIQEQELLLSLDKDILRKKFLSGELGVELTLSTQKIMLNWLDTFVQIPDNIRKLNSKKGIVIYKNDNEIKFTLSYITDLPVIRITKDSKIEVLRDKHLLEILNKEIKNNNTEVTEEENNKIDVQDISLKFNSKEDNTKHDTQNQNSFKGILPDNIKVNYSVPEKNIEEEEIREETGPINLSTKKIEELWKED